MVRRFSALLVPAIAAVSFGLPSANADHCNGNVVDLGGLAYIDDRESGGQAGGAWVYLESNGQAGLQSGGESILLGADDVDACSHENPDTLIV